MSTCAFIALKTACFQIKDIEHEGWLTKQGKINLLSMHITNAMDVAIYEIVYLYW